MYNPQSSPATTETYLHFSLKAFPPAVHQVSIHCVTDVYLATVAHYNHISLNKHYTSFCYYTPCSPPGILQQRGVVNWERPSVKTLISSLQRQTNGSEVKTLYALIKNRKVNTSASIINIKGRITLIGCNVFALFCLNGRMLLLYVSRLYEKQTRQLIPLTPRSRPFSKVKSLRLVPCMIYCYCILRFSNRGINRLAFDVLLTWACTTKSWVFRERYLKKRTLV